MYLCGLQDSGSSQRRICRLEFLQPAGNRLERRVSSFPLLLGLQPLQHCRHRSLLPETSCRCQGQAVSDQCSAAAVLGKKSQIFIVWLTPLPDAEGSTGAFWLGRGSNGTRKSTESDLVVRSVIEGSADTTGALSRLINPSDPTPKLKRGHLRFKERGKVCRMRQILHLVILG